MWGRRPPKKIRELSDLVTWPVYQAKLKADGKFKLAPAKERAAAACTIDNELNGKIIHFTGDITELKIDAIVNAANRWLAPGGGICGAIHSAAGGQLADECETLGECETGDTKITKGYRLPSKYVLHTVGPTNGSEEALRGCYVTCLDLCVKHNIRSIAFCCIATGIYGYPNRDAALLALRTVRTWLEHGDNRSKMDGIIFCTFMDVDVQLYDRFLSAFFPIDATDVALTDDEKAKLPPPPSAATAAAAGASSSSPVVVDGPAVPGVETKVAADNGVTAATTSSSTTATSSTSTSTSTGVVVASTLTNSNSILERRPSGVAGMDTRSDSDVHTLAARHMTQSQHQ